MDDEKSIRRKVVDREEFTYDEKKRISNKSDDRCTKCGRLVYHNYGATVDHFIPISKGGTNDFDNLIMMCHDCNYEKNDRIVSPKSNWTTYLKPEYKEKLISYCDKFIENYSYINRSNLLAIDEIPINSINWNDHNSIYNEKFMRKFNRLFMEYNTYGENSKMSKKDMTILKKLINTVYLKKARFDEFDQLQEYFKKILRKLNINNEREDIDTNIIIEFFYKFGCIYTIKDNINDDYKGIIPILFHYPSKISKESEDECESKKVEITRKVYDSEKDDLDDENYITYTGRFIVLPFVLSDKDNILDLVSQSITKLFKCIISENSLCQVPLDIVTFKNSGIDKEIFSTVCNDKKFFQEFKEKAICSLGHFNLYYTIIMNDSEEYDDNFIRKDDDEDMFYTKKEIEADKRFIEFTKNFTDVYPNIVKFFETIPEESYGELEWLKFLML